MSRAPGRHPGPPDRHQARRSSGSAGGATRDVGAARTRTHRFARARVAGCGRTAGRQRRALRDRSRHQCWPRHLEGRAACRGGRGRGHRCGDRRSRGQRLLRHPSARAPRHPRPGDGLLLLQQRGGRRTARARRARDRARRDRRLRRSPRQRHRRHHRRRRARLDGQHLPAPALSVQRGGAQGREHGQRTDRTIFARRRRARRGRRDVAATA